MSITLNMEHLEGFITKAEVDELLPKIEKAHNALRYAIYGLVMGVLAFTITNVVISFLI